MCNVGVATGEKAGLIQVSYRCSTDITTGVIAGIIADLIQV